MKLDTHISIQVVKIKFFFFLFICLCGVFNMLLDKPCANPLINTIAEYFLLKTVLPKGSPETWYETDLFLLRHKNQ